MEKIIGELKPIPKLSGLLHFRGNLCGTITSADQKMSGELAPAALISGNISHNCMLSGEISAYKPQQEIEPYTGSYTVTPKAFKTTTLYTNNKRMTNNVTVEEIPYYETSNLHGKTVIIGG